MKNRSRCRLKQRAQYRGREVALKIFKPYTSVSNPLGDRAAPILWVEECKVLQRIKSSGGQACANVVSPLITNGSYNQILINTHPH